MCDLFTLISTLYFLAFLLSFFLFPFFHLSDEQQPELNQKIMENLRNSATNGGEGTYDVLYLTTLSDAWTGFTRFILLNERPPDGNTWSGWRLTRKQTTSRPDNVWQDMWKHVSDASKRKAKQKWIIEKPKLDNARRITWYLLH